MAIFSRYVWFTQFLHSIPVSPIHNDQLPLQHICLSIEDVGVHQTCMVNQNSLQAGHVNITALEDSKQVLGTIFIDQQFEAKCFLFVTCTPYIEMLV